MIHDYYCLECGKKIAGEEIRFDIAEFLGLRKEDNEDHFRTSATMISPEELEGMVSDSEWIHGVRCTVNISLSEFIKRMAENENKEEILNKIDDYKFGDIDEIITNLYTGGFTGEEKDKEVGKFAEAIKAKFRLEKKSEDEEEENISLFKASFDVKPVFFEDGASDILYSVEYHEDERAANLRKIGKTGDIRGYCPECGKAIIINAGKYPHILVGLLGVQKAGKTSTIVAMLYELINNYRNIGIPYPTLLWDERTNDRRENLTLYRYGWAVKKTPVESPKGSFNASLLIQGSNTEKIKIISFVDIAGEHCYDKAADTMNREAFEVYKLINKCHIYLLCTGIAPDEAAKEDDIPSDAILKIIRGIYDNLDDTRVVPPACIVATKADLAANAEEQQIDQDNIFEEIEPRKDYLYSNELQMLKELYRNTSDQDVKRALEICETAYDDLYERTYVSMMSCWALGREAEPLPEGKDIHNIEEWINPETGKPDPFTRNRIDVLLKWILQVVGLLNIEDGYMFPYIPSWNEGYKADGIETWGERKEYTVDEACDRIGNVRKVFLNSSEKEDRILDEFKDAEPGEGVFSYFRNRRYRKTVKDLFGV